MVGNLVAVVRLAGAVLPIQGYGLCARAILHGTTPADEDPLYTVLDMALEWIFEEVGTKSKITRERVIKEIA